MAETRQAGRRSAHQDIGELTHAQHAASSSTRSNQAYMVTLSCGAAHTPLRAAAYVAPATRRSNVWRISYRRRRRRASARWKISVARVISGNARARAHTRGVAHTATHRLPGARVRAAHTHICHTHAARQKRAEWRAAHTTLPHRLRALRACRAALQHALYHCPHTLPCLPHWRAGTTPRQRVVSSPPVGNYATPRAL